MAEDNSNTSDNQNESSTSTENQLSRDQIAIAKELNIVLGEIGQRLTRISTLAQNQSNMAMQMSESFNEIHEGAVTAANEVNSITQNINEIAETAVESLGQGTSEQLVNTIEEVSTIAQKGASSQSQNLLEIGDNVNKTGEKSFSLNKKMSKIMQGLYGHMQNMFNSTNKLNGCLEGLKNAATAVKDTFLDLKDKISDLFSGLGGKIKAVFGSVVGGAKLLLTSVGAFAGAAAKFFKFSLTVPFTIAKAAANLGNKIRTDLVEVIQSSAEDLKETFDFDSYIGKGIQDMTSRGKGMLLAFQSPSSEMVKLFGYGAQGIANMIKEVGGNIAAMGHFSELFGRSIMGNGRRLKDFTKMVKGFGLSSEDIHYLALDAANNLEHINTRMARLGITLESVSGEFNIDRKRLSKNFMIMRKDITQFGHLSDEEIAKTTARLTQMRVKLEDAAAVFKKFSTFEDAANSVAILSQTFGMNLDAFDMIQAKNPEEIIDMFRNSMLETGRSFEDLNRFEKDLMAQHTGMSAESLAALMNYRDLGLTYEEARKKMAKETPEAKQMASLKKLNSAIKEVQKVLTFDSPFAAFADGLMANTTLSGELKNTMVSLSSGYQGIFEYAKSLDGDTWTGLVRPINYIINIMRGIFQSKAFKDGLVGTVKTIAEFVGNMFGVTNPDKALTELETQLKSSSSKDGVLDPKSTSKKSKAFKETLLTKLKEIDQSNLDAFGSLQGINKEAFDNIKDPLEMIPLLRKIQKEAQKNKALEPYFQNIMDGLQSRLKEINLKDPSVTPDQKSAVEKLVEGLKNVGKANEQNTGKLVSLSLRVTGAIIKGAGIGLIAVLKLVNEGVDKAQAYLKDQGKSTNMIEEFLNFKPGEFGQLGTEINKGIKAFMKNSKGMFSISAWLLGGLTDMFTSVIKFMMGVLTIGIDEMFGTSISKTARNSLARTSLPQGRKNTTSQSISNVARASETKSEVDIDDVSSLINALDEKIKSVDDKSTSKSLIAASKLLRKSFEQEGISQNTMQNIGLKAAALLGGINDKGEYTGNKRQINKIPYSQTGENVQGVGIPAFIHQARSFDENLIRSLTYIKQNMTNHDVDLRKIKKIVRNDKLSKSFDNSEFISFWIRNKDNLINAISLANSMNQSRQPQINKLYGQRFDQLEKEPYFKNFNKMLGIPEKLLTRKLPEGQAGPPQQGPEFTSVDSSGKVSQANDLTWLGKLASIGTYKNLLSNLMYSVSPLITGDAIEPNYSEYNPESNYNETSSLNLDRKKKGLTKQKAQEMHDKLCKWVEEIKDNKLEVNVETNFNKDEVIKLGRELAKNNLVGILSTPNNLEGVSYILDTAIGSRCINPGSRASAASQSLIEGE